MIPTKELIFKDQSFKLFIPQERIAERVHAMGKQMNRDYKEKNPLFLVVLNGAFMFASDLLRLIDVENRVSFIKLASYDGFIQADEVQTLIGIDESLEGRDIIVLEDIIDSGNTIFHFMDDLKKYQPNSIQVACLLLKPENLQHHDLDIKYVGFEISNEFVIGYGMDYDGLGRSLADLYQLNSK